MSVPLVRYISIHGNAVVPSMLLQTHCSSLSLICTERLQQPAGWNDLWAPRNINTFRCIPAHPIFHHTGFIPQNNIHQQPFLFVFAGPWSLDHCNPGTRQSWAEQAGRRGNLKTPRRKRDLKQPKREHESQCTEVDGWDCWKQKIVEWWISEATIFNFACSSRDVPFLGITWFAASLWFHWLTEMFSFVLREPPE